MQLFLKTLTGKTKVLMVEADETIMSVKEKIKVITGVPVDEQRLAFTGKDLESQNTISHYNIPNGATLFLVMKASKVF
jgi:hypothetical protein